MPNKSTEAGYHIVTPQGGVNQRDDVASLDNKTFSNVEGLVPRQTGMLERVAGKATLAKYADSVWSIAQMWSPAGLIAGYSQYGGSLTYQPWSLTWNPIDVTLPPWLIIDPGTNLTLAPVDGGGGPTNTSTNSGSGAAGGSGSGRRPHYEWQTFGLSINNNVQYKGDTSASYIAGRTDYPIDQTAPSYLPALNTTGSNSSSGFISDYAQSATHSLGSYHSVDKNYDLVTSQTTTEFHNTFSVVVTQQNAQVQLRYTTYKQNGDIITQLDVWTGISTNNYSSSNFLPNAPTTSYASASAYTNYRRARVEPTPATSGTYRALVKVWS